MSGALARKRCDPAKKRTGKCGTIGAKVAPFPSERRGPFPDPPPLSGKWEPGARYARKFTRYLRSRVLTLPTLSKKRGPVPGNACKITEDPQRQREVGGWGEGAWGWTGRFLYEKRAILIHELRHFEEILRFPSFKPPPGWAWGSPRGALGGYRTERIQHFEGSGPQWGRGNTSLRGGRAAAGPRKHVTQRGPGHDRDEET